jgi:hypothetical protein
MPDLSEIAVYLGLDVGKGEHHAVALTPAGKMRSGFEGDRGLAAEANQLAGILDPAGLRPGDFLRDLGRFRPVGPVIARPACSAPTES